MNHHHHFSDTVTILTFTQRGNVGFKELAQGSSQYVPRVWATESYTVKWQRFQIKSFKTPSWDSNPRHCMELDD